MLRKPDVIHDNRPYIDLVWYDESDDYDGEFILTIDTDTMTTYWSQRVGNKPHGEFHDLSELIPNEGD